MGIEEREVERAIAEQREHGKLDEAREAYMQRKREEFRDHLRAYLIVNAALMLINITIAGGTHHLWFWYPLIGWGIGLAFHASNAFHPGQRSIERGARRILRKRERLARRDRFILFD